MGKSFKWISLAVAFTIGFLGINQGFANAGGKAKFAYFSLEEVISKSKVGREAQSKFKAEEQIIRSKLQEKTSELQNLKNQLEKESKLLSRDAKEKKAKEFLEKKKAWEQLTLESRRKLNRLSNQMSSPIISDVLDIVKKLGKKGGYTFIFEVQRAGIAYAPEKLNITDQVIKELDKRAKKSTKK